MANGSRLCGDHWKLTPHAQWVHALTKAGDNDDPDIDNLSMLADNKQDNTTYPGE